MGQGYRIARAQMPIVFYDTETTGTQTAFDLILQFAAIKTDDDLNRVDRFDIPCRLMPLFVADAFAERAHHLSASRNK